MYEELIQKLDHFIRRYYLDKLIRGSLYALGFIVLAFLLATFLEAEFYFSKTGRVLLFGTFLLSSVAALAFWVFRPLLSYFRLGKVISHEQAAVIIGNHFSDVEDKLLNILQLRKQADEAEDVELILAGIEQKSAQIRLVPFKKAIDLSVNKKYIGYTLVPLLLLISILLIDANFIKQPTQRLIHLNKDFKKPAPFSFVLDEEKPEVVQYEDYPLEVKIEGETLPDEVYITFDGLEYRLKKEAPDRFIYRFKKVQKDRSFRLFAGPVTSKEYELKVLKKPNLLGFDIQLDYPAYTGRKDETISNTGDLLIPAGTRIVWNFKTENAGNIGLLLPEQEQIAFAERRGNDMFYFKHTAMKPGTYKLFLSNEMLPNADSITYSMNVIPDEYPVIEVEEFPDSADHKWLYFIGETSDDYGLVRLTFNYRITSSDGQSSELVSLPIPLSNSGKKQPKIKNAEYTHSWNLGALDLKPGDQVSYYFEVFDNDAIHGSKSSRTQPRVYAMPTVEEFEKIEEENDEEIQERLNKALKKRKKIQEQLKKKREELLQKEEPDWQDRKELEKLLERQKELMEEIRKAREAYKENLENQQEFRERSEDILQKQEQLQKLMDETMDEEMQKLMEEIQKMLDEMQKDEALKQMEEFQLSEDEMEKELDRALELFKELQLEQKMDEVIQELEDLAEQQEKLSEETANEEKPQEELQKEQEDINEKFDELQEKMEDIQKMNKELEKPKPLEDHKEESEKIEEDLDKSQEQLEQKENQGASKSQKSASQKMRQMAQSMSGSMKSMAMDQMMEDMEALRQLLENLLTLSFDQENLQKDFQETAINTPRYVELVNKQFKLEDDFRLVEDSLQALSKRVFQIESYVMEKVGEIKTNMKDATDQLEERKVSQASKHQQYVMKNLNDLALMLDEVMQQMQMQMSGMMSGNQMCNNPGQGKGGKGNVPKDKISKGQKEISEQMRKMHEQMQNGNMPSSEEFAKTAAKQAALREALRQMQKELQQQGKGSKELEEIMDQMNKIETDLVNKRLTNEMMKRQQEILTRLLEHEKAERQRDKDNKRKSETAQDYQRKLPPALEEYLRKRQAETEELRSVSPRLNPYYKRLVEDYFKKSEEN